jgi:hypothetical protein
MFVQQQSLKTCFEQVLCGQVESSKWILLSQKAGVKCGYAFPIFQLNKF